MTRGRSAYDVLGLSPGASREAIEEAYRRLIKTAHPDVPGGDRARAEEIIRAYRRLRPNNAPVEPICLDPPERLAGNGRPWRPSGIALALGALIIALLTVPIGARFGGGEEPIVLPAPLQRAITPRASEPFDRPVDAGVIDNVVADTVKAFKELDEMALAAESRQCHQAYQQDPTISALDRCVAFDDAVVFLQNRDPIRDRGPFRDDVVVRRHWRQAALLGNDNVAIDTRFDRIKLQVELKIASLRPASDGLVSVGSPNAVSVEQGQEIPDDLSSID